MNNVFDRVTQRAMPAPYGVEYGYTCPRANYYDVDKACVEWLKKRGLFFDFRQQHEARRAAETRPRVVHS